MLYLLYSYKKDWRQYVTLVPLCAWEVNMSMIVQIITIIMYMYFDISPKFFHIKDSHGNNNNNNDK